MGQLVPMARWSIRVRFAGWLAAGSVAAAVAIVTAMSKHVHGDKGYRNQYPEPVRYQPIHDMLTSSVGRESLLNS